ncbi:SIR2 family protein [Zymobacter palmae]|uniref:DNA primase n=1 Tax=Zymobacter palmae TaxID=33074 RepID=A0A348HCW3_9GAMM|nr:SIR2 family protein [Zymobacter palmae]BBG29465.1 DNA primase [Zymobacter palmae]
MKIMDVNSAEFKEMIKLCINTTGLIPVIGAGFTKGEKALGGTVPDGNGLIDLMIGRLKKEGNLEESKISRLCEKKDFKSVSRYYLSQRYVSRESFVEDIKNNFTKVELSYLKKRFIENKWRYVYTLNIDDAIERQNKNLTKILPYKKIEKRANDINLVYKVHGCAMEECTYIQESTLVFTDLQYVRSLIKNEHILQALRSDMLESNMLYIGCSLSREIDLMYSVSGEKEDDFIESKKIFITRNCPDEMMMDEIEDYGINVVGLLENYDDIYRVVNEAFLFGAGDETSIFDNFDSKNIKKISSEKNSNISFMLQGGAVFKEGDNSNKNFSIPCYSIDRSLTPDVIKSILSTPFTIIKGRRFSGKSLFLKNLSQKIKDKKVYFVPSSFSLNVNEIEKICSVKDSIFLIDSNVITYLEASKIRAFKKQIIDSGVKFLIACNPTEIDVANTFSSLEIETGFFELKNRFDLDELQNFNEKVSELGIIEWKKDCNFLDNSYATARNYPQMKQEIFDYPKINKKEFKLLILLALLDKVYISLGREIGFGNNEANDFSKKYSPIVEIIETTKEEENHKSKFKLVSNSKTWLFSIIKDYMTDSLKDNELSEVMIEMISHFYKNKQLEEVGKKLIMFDTVNQFFSRERGAGRLLIKLYEDLQPILSHDPDYWLQRAKAMGKIVKDPRHIFDAIDYAKKAYNDGKRSKTLTNAEFTIANLYGLLCNQDGYKDENIISSAIGWYYSAIKNHNYNKSYLESMLEITKDKKGNLYNLCSKIMSNNIKLDSEARESYNEIMRFIRQ